MNPAKSYAHLFSPLGGDAGDNYRAPNVLTFLRSSHVALNAQALKKSGARYAFLGVPFDEHVMNVVEGLKTIRGELGL